MITTSTKTEIEVIKTTNSRLSQVDFSNLPFGRIFSDHMFIMDYKDGAWQKPQIRPFENFSFSPSTSALHYGQSIFEGMKAYRNKNNEVFIFRPDMNYKRMNHSAQRMCMPEIPTEIFKQGLEQLISLDRNWIPNDDGSSLYIRPFLFATDEFVGIRPSETYRFCIFTCPVGRYYSEPVRVRIEPYYSRAVEGGTGTVKAAGNYGGALYPAKQCQDAGFHQLVWTDAKEHKYIEESGTMNVMFMVGDKIITPMLSGTILDGVTRNSIITVAKDWGITVEERKVSVDEIIAAAENGTLVDAWGAGTAATIAQIKIIGYKDKKYELSDLETRPFTNKLMDYFDKYRRGLLEDKFGWRVKIG
ncbi:MAG TPA: branched-chain amino acid aminotransferase [Flavobacteriales bacterium]|nr:branched-chain amino acid aminotransferase [Flavobacteriales bacterium]